MNGTLLKLGFYEQVKRKNRTDIKPRETVSVDEPRWCALQQFEIRDDEAPRAKAGDGDVQCLLRHVRNAFAHGQTYILSNRMLLLCDQDNKPTARILIKADTLVHWVKYIDIRGDYYFKDDNRLWIEEMLS